MSKELLYVGLNVHRGGDSGKAGSGAERGEQTRQHVENRYAVRHWGRKQTVSIALAEPRGEPRPQACRRDRSAEG